MSAIVALTEFRCFHCKSEFSAEQIDSAVCCPKCHSERSPHRITEDISVKINWADLRVLVAYAQNWARKHGDSDSVLFIEDIASSVSDLRPAGAVALTVVEEVLELQAQGYDVHLEVDGHILVPRRPAN